MRRETRRCIFIIAGTAMMFCLLLAAGCSDGGGDTKAKKVKPPPLVETQPAATRNISHFLTLNGSVEPVRVARLASAAEGPVMNCRVREGDRVGKGDFVLNIGRSATAKALLASAREDLKKEEEELRRVEKLVQSGALPGDALDGARANCERARSRVANAGEKLLDYEVKIPWDGIVCSVLVRDGDYVNPRTPLMEMFDPASLIIRLAIPESKISMVHENTEVAVVLDAYPGQTFTARISRIYPELDRRTRTQTLEATLETKKKLIPGMFARVSIPVATVEDAVVLPESAILTAPQGEKVVFVVADGRASKRKVKTGIEEGRLIQILEGIRPGERVVVAGNETLKDKQKVRLPGGKSPIKGGKTGKTQGNKR